METDKTYLAHHGIKGQKWGVRRYQNEDGSRTALGKAREYEHMKRRDKKKYMRDLKEDMQDDYWKIKDSYYNTKQYKDYEKKFNDSYKKYMDSDTSESESILEKKIDSLVKSEKYREGAYTASVLRKKYGDENFALFVSDGKTMDYGKQIFQKFVEDNSDLDWA